MANMKMVNGISVPCDEIDEAFIKQKEIDFAIEKEKYDKIAYLDKRKNEYPSVQAQLCALWDAMESGEIPKASAFYDAIKAVNDKYPK